MTVKEHAHHFESADHEFISCKQGMWLFLLQEVLFFAGLFCAYMVFRGMYPDMFLEASKLLDWKLGGLNTIVLITSSLTMAMAVRSAQTNQKNQTVMYLTLTFVLAGVFMIIKYFEYSHKIHLGILPGGFFTYEGLNHPKAPLYFSLYFLMTGVHGLHVLIGMLVIIWLIVRANRGDFNSHYYTPIEMVGLYWHFVDLVWIYLFPLMYLVG